MAKVHTFLTGTPNLHDYYKVCHMFHVGYLRDNLTQLVEHLPGNLSGAMNKLLGVFDSLLKQTLKIQQPLNNKIFQFKLIITNVVVGGL